MSAAKALAVLLTFESIQPLKKKKHKKRAANRLLCSGTGNGQLSAVQELLQAMLMN